MQSTTSSSSASSASSSSHSSQHQCNREEKGIMSTFQHLHLRHTPPPPPPPPSHCRGKKHHRRHHSHPPPSPPSHHHFIDHPHHSPLVLPCSDHHHGKLRVKRSKKVRKLHHKLMKAYKLPKRACHGRHHHHMHFPPPKEGFFGHHPPACCLHSMEEEGFPCDQERHPRHRAHCHPSHKHKMRPMCPSVKSEAVGGAVAVVSPSGAEAPAEPPTEGGAPPLASADMLPAADETAMAL